MKKRTIIVSVLFLLFISLVILIKTNVISGFDTWVYNIVTIKMSTIITNMYKVFTFFGSTSFIVFLCAFFLVLFIILKKNSKGYIITICLIISTIMNNVIKVIIRRPRPEVLALVTEKSFSFPSGHTMASVSMYGMLIYLLLRSSTNKKTKIALSILLGILPFMIGLSRIYLGAHFASDIIGGIIVSSILLLIETYFIDKKKWY